MQAENIPTTRFAIRETVGLLVLGIALFWSSGDLGWWPGWAYLLVMAGWTFSTGLVILRNSPELLAERLGPRTGAQAWDTRIMSVYGLVQLAMYIVAGLDHRFGWSSITGAAGQIVALAVCVAGNALVVWATAANAYFSQIVRIQDERDHAVAKGGPYQLVRHPGYLGTVAFALAGPILLNSVWALMLGVIGAALIVVRTQVEDQFLQANLPGYHAYARDVRQRLLPGVW